MKKKTKQRRLSEAQILAPIKRDGSLPPQRDEPSTITMDVTPLLAGVWLERYNTENRNPRGRRIETLRKAIERGDWKTLSSQGLCFSRDGVLLDGQNRLNAIKLAGKTVRAVVTFNEDPEAMRFLDTGAPRHAHDISKIRGLPWRTEHLSCARSMITHTISTGRRRSYSADEIIAFCDQYSEIIEYAVRVIAGSKRGVKSAPVMAGIAKAAAHLDHNKLSDFVQVLREGVCFDSEFQPAITLRDYLLSSVQAGTSSTEAERRTAVYKTMRAIKAFESGEELKQLKASYKDYYPLQHTERWA